MFDTSAHEQPEPIFTIGEEVEFEVAKGKNYARWDYTNINNINIDLGGSGVWAKGVIVDAEEALGGYSASTFDIDFMGTQYIYVKYEIDEMVGAGYAGFPRKNNVNYNSWQWSRKGFLRKSSRCVCGAEKCNTTHSFWCEKYVKYK
jgi:hypothetical protein